MSRIIVWGGHHSREIMQLIKEVYLSEDGLLILCPPRIKDISPWLEQLPSGEIEFTGELAGIDSITHSSSVCYPQAPKFGLFSTGTVEGAKLILYSNQNFEASLAGIFSFFSHLKITTVFSYPQPYHIFGLSLGYLASLIQKFELVAPEGSYSREAHEQWLQTAATDGNGLLTLGTPTHFLDALKFCQDNGLSAPESLTCIAGGAKVEKNLWHILQNNLHIDLPSIGYGCSEASPGVTHLPPGIAPEDDGDLGMVLPNGSLLHQKDEILYQGENVCLAIIQNGQIYFPQGKYKLSDSLIRDERGHYHYRSRHALILNRGGEKFSLEEIEALIKKNLQIDCVALALDDARLGSELGLVFVGEQESKNKILNLLMQTYQRSFRPELFTSTETLPLNPNAKYDRQECLKLLTLRNKMNHVSELADSLPHRDKMVWIDYVSKAQADGGECVVKIDPSKHYFSSQGVRQSAFIEWMAQGYGFVNAQYFKEAAVAKTLEKAFLVGVEKVTFGEKLPGPGEEIIVAVKTVRNVGPISYVEGRVFSSTPETTYCEALIKLFSIETQP